MPEAPRWLNVRHCWLAATKLNPRHPGITSHVLAQTAGESAATRANPASVTPAPFNHSPWCPGMGSAYPLSTCLAACAHAQVAMAQDE